MKETFRAIFVPNLSHRKQPFIRLQIVFFSTIAVVLKRNRVAMRDKLVRLQKAEKEVWCDKKGSPTF